MSEADEPPPYLENDFEDNGHQACYIFRPFSADEIDNRPAKKRKVGHAGKSPQATLPRLCHGDELEEQSTQRLEALQHVWATKQEKIDWLVFEHDGASLKEIVNFAATITPDGHQQRLHTGLIVSGPDSSVQTRLFSRWKAELADRKSEVLIQLNASSCPSLQVSLKNVIKHAVVDHVGLDGYAKLLARYKQILPLNFDLELLQLFVEEHGIKKIIVSLVDVETFDTSTLSQILWTLGSWSTRIPFIVLLGIATTVELLESRLPKSTVEQLDAKTINLVSPDDLLYQIFATVQHDEKNQIFFGPSILGALHELSQSQATTISAFVNVLKVAIMSHFFADTLSILACEGVVSTDSEKTLCAAIRHTESFRSHCENLLPRGDAARARLRSYLDDDSVLLSAVRTAVIKGQKNLRLALRTIKGLHDLHKHSNVKYKPPFMIEQELYNSIDDLTHSTVYQDILRSLRKASSRQILDTFENLEPSTLSDLNLQPVLKQLQTFQQAHGNESVYARDKSSTNTFGTTKSPSKSNISAAQTKYTALLESLINHITEQFQTRTYSFDSFMHEAYVIDSRQLLMSLSTPRPRHVLERALSKPADYLGCECNIETANVAPESETEHIAPPTSILYHLLQEAGTIINVRDLFGAFQSRFNPSTMVEHDQDEEDGNPPVDADDAKQRMALAIFYRSLSELKMMGMVKSSTSAMTKKRALASEGLAGGKGKKAYAEIDFIAKTSWAGL